MRNSGILSRHPAYTVVVVAILIVSACGGNQGDVPVTTVGSAPTTGQTSPTTIGDTAPRTTVDGDAASATTVVAELENTTVRMAFSQPAITAVTFEKWRRELEETHGITVELLEFEGSDQILRSLLVGEVDVASMNPLPVLQVIQETGEADFKMVAASRKATTYLLVADPSLTSVEDLENPESTVGISTPGDASDTFTRYVLDEMGVDVDTVNFVQIGGTSARMAALFAGQISAGAAHIAEALTAMEEGGLENLVTYSDHMGDYLQPALTLSNEFIDTNPVLTQFLVDTYIDSVRWAVDEPQEFEALALEWLPDLDPEIVRRSMEIMYDSDTFAVNGGLEDETIESTLEIEQALGYLDDPIPETELWIDTTFIEDYLERNERR